MSVRKPKQDNKNQKPFERILIMEHELVGIGTVKMTVGVRRSTHEKIQYSASYRILTFALYQLTPLIS